MKRKTKSAVAAPTGKDEILQALTGRVNTYSSPSDLKITDLRTATVCSNYDYPIIRIDTNQGVYGIGEVRCASRACCWARTRATST
jgi:hypothetical protein